ncbi:MAG: DUF1579 domain-containing protein [Planctomycetota bacterium]|nr:DUF1579 domain-containing protein [Planctomycetota bacterium]
MQKALPVLLFSLALCAGFADSQEQPDLEAMFKYAKPGKHHAELGKFIGKWDVETTLIMPGGKEPVTTKGGSAEYSWLFEGRWLQGRLKSSFMGMPYEQFSIMGFDNYRQNWTTVVVSNFDTAMRMVTGVPVDPKGKVRAQYGTLDEPSMRQTDKAYKVVTKIANDDKFHMEIWDLGIGEAGMKVMQFSLTRQKDTE